MVQILVVDDSPVDRMLISATLQRNTDWTVSTANDGHQAIDAMRQSAYDIVVTDLQMPELDGLGLVRAIRSEFLKVPVVLVTAFGSEKQSVAALQAGAANFSLKSRLKTDLVPTVRNVLNWAESVRRANEESREAFDMGSVKRSLAFVLDNNVGQIRNLIETLDTNLPDWAEQDSIRISMALEEALCNAICHGNLEVDSELKESTDCSAYENKIRERKDAAPFCERRVRVHAEFTEQSIRFQIDDEGPGFNPQKLPDPTTAENILRPSGRGLLLIRSFMDEVHHNQTGNRITLVKNRCVTSCQQTPLKTQS
ncbi:MAG: response regulator [Pirellulaceae bacterium]|nr:response regulator [Pirellulaceae bacterium]